MEKTSVLCLLLVFQMTQVSVTQLHTDSSNISSIEKRLYLHVVHTKRSALIQSARILDKQIDQIIAEIEPVATATRAKLTETKEKGNKRAWSYGVSVALANGLYSWSYIYGKSKAELTTSDWAVLVANSGYTWGYAGPFLIEGQLDSPEPACGASDIFQAMNEFGLPSLSEVYSVLESADGSMPPYQLLEPGTSTSILQQMALERSLAMKSAGSCLIDSDEGAKLKGVINRLEVAVESRLDITESLLQTLKEEYSQLY
ncbi:uncharacterized protein LOC111714645 isoform X2 [Eurytemora carolleeae]|uniref:uncharacterized protein LOC111714645 isoform X2 n=1 Tax=Eurytemora carolleeae TaxID=1294199 RepID=UPI000C78C2DE|nr:uncharacterized protein LOC111714645 isoform X2 [Eurytemora carolleeae]|eukprot:XP_023345564.1 uncharacterized protein LOC111714645 isoform X2 [Eurytemora affinis]